MLRTRKRKAAFHAVSPGQPRRPLRTGALFYRTLQTTISLLLPILSVNIIEAVLRFPLDKQENHEYISDVYTVGLRYTIIGCGLLVILLWINHVLGAFPTIVQYEQYVILVYIVQAFNQLLLSFSRATNHVKEVSVAGVITSVVLIGLNLLFLLYFK